MRRFTLSGHYTRQLILSPDGGTAGLDWWRGCDRLDFTRPDAPILLVLHGINGGSHEGYCKHACEGALSRGWRGVVLNYRGCNGLPLTSPRTYNATLTQDAHNAIVSIKRCGPSPAIFNPCV
jgi:abhydrolase domain-containing protein 1/3